MRRLRGSRVNGIKDIADLNVATVFLVATFVTYSATSDISKRCAHVDDRGIHIQF